MYCYYKARPNERGFLKRMMNEWKTRGNFDCTQQRIANQKKNILDKNLLTEAELRTIRDQVGLLQDSPNEDPEEPPTVNDDPQQDPDQAAEDPEQAAEGPEQAAEDADE